MAAGRIPPVALNTMPQPTEPLSFRFTAPADLAAAFSAAAAAMRRRSAGQTFSSRARQSALSSTYTRHLSSAYMMLCWSTSLLAGTFTRSSGLQSFSACYPTDIMPTGALPSQPHTQLVLVCDIVTTKSRRVLELQTNLPFSAGSLSQVLITRRYTPGSSPTFSCRKVENVLVASA